MPLLSETLSVWEVAHRWAGLDPSAIRLRLPLAARDNFRILIDAILNGEIDSLTLQLRKWSPADGEDERKYFVRYYMDDVYACIWGKKFNRTMLRQATIHRHEMKRWCERHSIPLPEFWFPPGWGYGYDWHSEDLEVELAQDSQDASGEAIRPSTMAKIACQQIAQALWKEQPNMTIADMVKHSAIQQYGGAAVYTPATVRVWLSATAPAEVSSKRGRPRKKIPGDELPESD